MKIENVDRLIQRAQILRVGKVDQALKILDEALTLAQQCDYKRGMAIIIRDRAICFLQQHEFKLALAGFTEALEFFKLLGDTTGQITCNAEVSAIHLELGDLPSAMEYILANLRIYMTAADSEGIAECYTEIASLYIHLENYEKAIDYFKMALKLFEGLKIRRKTINCFYHLGDAFMQINDENRALFYFLRASNSLEEARDIDIKTKTLGGLAKLYTIQQDYQKAMDTFQQALRIAETGASLPVKVQLKKNLGNLFLELNQTPKSIEVLSDALRMSASMPANQIKVKLHYLLALAYEKAGDVNLALKFYKEFHELENRLASDTMQLKTKALHFKFDLEELQKEKDIAVLSDKMKEQFLSNISYEIRTPMNGIMGMTHLLDNTRLNSEQKEFVQAIKTSADHLMSMINDIIDFSNINSGKIEFSKSEFSLREVVKSVLQPMKFKADEKQLKLTVAIDFNILDQLNGDAVKLNQILNNLLGNAIKFTSKGKVHLDIKQIDSGKDNCRIQFKISDTGIGIPENQLNRIFESFEQVKMSDKRRAQGTGLGLAIVKQLVELQGGIINVQSKTGQGSVFTFELGFEKVIQKTSSTDKTSNKEENKLSHLSILVAEDNKVNQLLIKNMLRKFGITKVETAENGKDVLRKVEQQSYDLVLMDIQMPLMDGFEATRLIRQRLPESKKNIPIIAISADASEEEKTRAFQSGMNDYVIKPYTPEELFNAIVKFATPTPIVSDEELAITMQKKRSLPGINIDALEKFTEGDKELTIQVMEIFLRQVPEAIQKIEKSIGSKDWKEVFNQAHKIKSSLSVFGLNELREIAFQIESNARDESNTSEINNLFDSFRQKATPVIEAIVEELEKVKEA